jgi:hypothetical protein
MFIAPKLSRSSAPRATSQSPGHCASEFLRRPRRGDREPGSHSLRLGRPAEHQPKPTQTTSPQPQLLAKLLPHSPKGSAHNKAVKEAMELQVAGRGGNKRQIEQRTSKPTYDIAPASAYSCERASPPLGGAPQPSPPARAGGPPLTLALTPQHQWEAQ